MPSISNWEPWLYARVTHSHPPFVDVHACIRASVSLDLHILIWHPPMSPTSAHILHQVDMPLSEYDTPQEH